MPIILDPVPPSPPPVPPVTVDGNAALITSEHNQRAKFMANVQALLGPPTDMINALIGLRADFDLDTAIGDQLDVVGQWIGLSRHVPLALEGVYFSLDVEGLGLDQGSLLGPGDPITGLTRLPDDVYRQFLRTQIAKNRWDGTVSQAIEVLNTVFTGEDIGFVFQDGGDMSMTFGLLGTGANAVLRALFENGFMDFKPAGVRITHMISTDAPLFGLDIENDSIAGLDVGAFSSI